MKTGTVQRLTGLILNILVTVLVLGVFLIGLTAFISKAGSGVPDFVGYRPFTVQTESMVPTLEKGDLIIDRKVTDARSLKTGDIITFWTYIGNRRILNTHRIVNITDNGDSLYFTTRGDNNTADDVSSVYPLDIVGKYQFRIGKVGGYIDWLKTAKGFFIGIVIPGFLFFLANLLRFIMALLAYNEAKTREKYNK